MGWMQTLLTFLLLLRLIACCKIFDKTFGNITEDQELEIGSTLRLRCSLFPDQVVTSENLSLEFGGNVLEDIHIIDDLTIEYVIPSATVNDTGYYLCFVRHPDYIVKQIVCSSHVAVGYKPQPVEKFSCISEEYRNLTCTWKPPYNPVETDYKLHDYIFSPKVNRTCKEVLNKTSCQFRVDSEPVYIKYLPILHFILVGKNSLGEITQFINIDHFKIVKPGVPKFIICTNITQNSLFLRYNAPKGLDYGEAPSGLVYNIKYQSVSTNLQNTTDIVKSVQKDLLITIPDLIPHTIYEFQVRVRLNISGDEYYWSDPHRHTEKTQSDVPYLAPEVTRSAFDVQVIAGNRSITLYWKAIQSEFENGEKFHYVIRYHEHHIPFRFRRDLYKTSNEWIILPNRTSHTFESMDTNSAYMFSIIAVNNVGKSTNESSIVVDKMERILSGPKDIMVISYEEGNYSLTWNDPNSETTHFTLLWCKTLKSQPDKCDGSIEWLHTSKTMYQLLLPDYKSNYQFAVAANRNHQTSGMVWAPCIASYNGVRYKVNKIKLLPKNATSLGVQWSLGCKARVKVIKKYLISYCPYGNMNTVHMEGKCVVTDWKCDAGWTNVTVLEPAKEEYILSALKPFTCYFAFVRVLSNSGWGENSNYAYEATMPSAPSDPPRNVVANSVPVNPYSVEIELLFSPPAIPNGIITKYRVYYNDTSSEDSYFHTDILKEEEEENYRFRIKNFIYYNKNYSVEVSACVHQACSKLSSPLYVYTGISTPTVVRPPRIELSESIVNITWDPPNFPNGPVDFYEVELYSNETDRNQHYIVNSSSSLTLKRDCDTVEPDESVYNFRVRAVNVGNDRFLYGDYSQPTKMIFCPSGKSIGFLIGAIAGAVIVCVIFLIGGMYLFHKCRGEYLARKNINIKLPLELETPFGNRLNTFDKLKNGLQKTAPDSSIPSDRAYERLCSFAQEGNNCEPDKWCEKDASSHRNHSGESNKSGVSSTDTTRTIVSMDSSGESDSSEPSHSENGMNEITLLTDNLAPQFVNNANNTAKSFCFVLPRRSPIKPIIHCDDLGIMPSYCKFSEIPSLPDKQLIAESENQYQTSFSDNIFPENLYKMHSEPSLYSYSTDESIVSASSIPPYSKVGLSRSNTQLCELNRPSNTHIGYSRFGTIYSPCTVQNNTQIFTVFVPPGPFLSSKQDKNSFLLKEKCAAFEQQLPVNGYRNAYSKFGVSKPAISSNDINYVAVGDIPSHPVKDRTFDLGLCAASVLHPNVPDPSHLDQTIQSEEEEDDDPRTLLEIIAADERFCAPPANPENSSLCNGNEEVKDEPELTAYCQDANIQISDFWENFNGNALPLSVEDYLNEEDLSGVADHAKSKTNVNNYLPLSELAKQRLISTNSITCTNLTDTPVASI